MGYEQSETPWTINTFFTISIPANVTMGISKRSDYSAGSTVPYVVERIIAQGEKLNHERVFLPTGKLKEF